MALLNRTTEEWRMKHEESSMARQRIASRARALVFSFFIFHSSFAAESLPESQIKAAFLVNFPKYVDWPAEAFVQTNSPVIIAVLGRTEVTAELRKIITGRSVNGRPLLLKPLASGEEPGSCHILFISATAPELSPDVLARLTADAVLTVGESAEFLERGGIINLARREQKIALEVNLPAAEHARIEISSKLLSVARVVKAKPK